MPLRALPKSLADWHGKPVLLRVDWNIPLGAALDAESSLKIERSLPVIHRLQQAGAKVVVLTHLGRPTAAREAALSTGHLLPVLEKVRLKPVWVGADLAKPAARLSLRRQIDEARPGSLFLLENVRFFSGEEKSAAAFAQGLATLADVFVNDAFAVCHRAHASVVGVAKHLPAYAGPALESEAAELAGLLGKPAAPFVAFVGGKKISTKLPVIDALCKRAQTVFLAGAMALACEAARGRSVGASYVEPGQKAAALRLLKRKNVRLPLDYVVAPKLEAEARTRISDLADIESHELAVDIGPRTLVAWAEAVRGAKTALWNGPVGIAEIPAFAAGSRGLARFLGYLPHRARTVVGGGDTLPILADAGVTERISFVSTGGGAMLDFLVDGERLPGLRAVSNK